MNTWKTILARLKKDIWAIRWVIPAAALYFLILYAVFGTICPIKALTGIPCPGCGMTRALGLLLTGQFARSFQMHPLLILWILYFLYLAVMRYLYGRKPKGMLVLLVILCIAMFIVYGYRMLLLFTSFGVN